MAERQKISVRTLAERKKRGERIAMIAAYDYPSAKLADAAGIDAILVGDSLGMVVLGHETTINVTLEMILHHTAAVARARPAALVIGDMPFMSCHVNQDEAVRAAGRILQEGGAGAVKLEGGASVLPLVRRLTESGIPVMAHVGLQPQSVHVTGGFRVQGRDPSAAREIFHQAVALQEAGAFAVVLELVPDELSQAITGALAIPTIGIGAGVHCDGQVLLLHDLAGLNEGPPPRHARVYAAAGELMRRAIEHYVAEVREGAFPGEAETVRQPALAETAEWKS